MRNVILAAPIHHETDPHCEGCWVLYVEDNGFYAECNVCRVRLDLLAVLSVGKQAPKQDGLLQIAEPTEPESEGRDELICTNCGSVNKCRTIKYDTPGEAIEYDAECTLCGSREVEDSYNSALHRVIDQRDALQAQCDSAPRWRTAGEYVYKGPAKSLQLEVGEHAYISYRKTGQWFVVEPPPDRQSIESRRLASVELVLQLKAWAHNEGNKPAGESNKYLVALLNDAAKALE